MKASFEDVCSAFQAGRCVMVFDEHREKEGDFFVLAEHIDAVKVNFMMTYGKGLLCVACEKSIVDRMELPLMVEDNDSHHTTSFTVSFDAKEGITTGVSASDMAVSIKLLPNREKDRTDIVLPGHTFPLLAQDPQKRFGHTEAAVELAKKVKKVPAVAICEILNKDGEKASLEELIDLCEGFDVPWVTLESLREELIG